MEINQGDEEGCILALSNKLLRIGVTPEHRSRQRTGADNSKLHTAALHLLIQGSTIISVVLLRL